MSNTDKLKTVVANIFNIDRAIVSEETSVDSVESWDSLNHLKLVLALEQEFNVSFTEEQSVEILSYPLIRITLEEHGIKFN